MAELSENILYRNLGALEAQMSRPNEALDRADYRGSFPGETLQVSIGGSIVTYQSLEALRRSVDGAAIVGAAQTAQAQQFFATEQACAFSVARESSNIIG